MKTHEPTRKRSRLIGAALRSAVALFLICLFIAAGFAIGVFVQSKPQWAVLSTAASDEEFNRRVADYLVDNPEAIAEAFEQYAARQGGSDAISRAPTTTPRESPVCSRLRA